MPPLVRKTLHVKTGKANAPLHSRCLQLLPKQNACMLHPGEQQKEVTSPTNTWDQLWTLSQQSCVWKKTVLCLQRMELTCGGNSATWCFFKTLWGKTEGWVVFFFVNSSVLVTDVYVPFQPSKIKHSAQRTGGTQLTLRYCLHLKLNTWKVHLVMVPFRGTAPGEQVPDAEEIKDALMAYIIKGGCT